MTASRYYCLLFFSFLTFQLSAQAVLTPNQQKISASLLDYFKMDRENMHLHLNKNAYLTNEKIWFKGYIIEKKYKPALFTSNVYVSLYDSDGQKLSTQLYYAEGNIFEGYVSLNKTLKSGKYYLQAYTNFMNNFTENESSVYEITVLNTSDKGYSLNKKPNLQTFNIDFFPESGIFLEGVSNTIGVKIVDCNGRGIALQDAEILDSKGTVVSNFSTNQFGYGKFDINLTSLEIYKAAFTIDGKKTEKTLPMPVATGVSFSVVNYMYPNKTILKLKTNSKTFEDIWNNTYTLVFQQNETTSFVDISFKEHMEQTLTVPNTSLADGINTVYLIDKNLKKVGERIIYNPFSATAKTLLNVVKTRSDSIVITGSSPIVSGTMSISVLPVQTISESPEKTIQSSLQLDNYLEKPCKDAAYYLADFSRKKHFELDAFLLSEKSKYDWDNMLGTPPVKTFDSDAGITIKGTINSEIKSSEVSINLSSLILGLNEMAPLNAKNEFFFEHILAQDSTKIYFTAIDKKTRKPDIKVYSQLLNNKRAFMKPFPNYSKCPETPTTEEMIAFPKFENTFLLDSITIISKKNKLMHTNVPGNSMARGFKISDIDAASYRDVLQFISQNGFTISQEKGNTVIRSYVSSTNLRNSDELNPLLNGPAVYIDGTYVQSYDMLRDYSMALVDEIYLNKTGYDISVRGSRGIIRIYTKSGSGIQAPQIIKKSEALLVKNAFQRHTPYENPKYDSVRDEGFLKLGSIDWKPIVMTDEKGTFHFSIPNLYQKSVKLVIEGMSPEGLMVSETVVLAIP